MRLQGIHHVAAITADALDCIEFYGGILGLETVARPTDRARADAPRLDFATARRDSPRTLTFASVPGTLRGRAGAGMAHRIRWRVAESDALGFWTARLQAAGVAAQRVERPESVLFTDPEGLAHELVVAPGPEGRARRSGPIPTGWELQELDGVRAYARLPEPSADLLAGRLEFVADRDGFALGGGAGGTYAYDDPPSERGIQGAGTVHHVAWACDPGDQLAWRQRVIGMGAKVTPILDRASSRSFYFREPSGVLFEIAAHQRRAPAPEEGDPLLFAPTAELQLPATA